MGFRRDEVESLLAACHRRCCICHRFCGVKMETDHIEPSSPGGSDLIENAIAVCFDCHAEIHHYNDEHPRGRKFSAGELKKHKEQWLDICKNHPEVLISFPSNSDVGPLQAVINELEFNMIVGQYNIPHERGCPFKDEQFNRAISQGAIWTLDTELKNKILEAYAAMGRANQNVVAELNQRSASITVDRVSEPARKAIEAARPKIRSAYESLSSFLLPSERA